MSDDAIHRTGLVLTASQSLVQAAVIVDNQVRSENQIEEATLSTQKLLDCKQTRNAA